LLAVRIALFLLSAATLAFEINLTRLFSVAQFYHFAFMIVSLALLGFGASGTLLAVFPAVGRSDPRRSLARLSLACGAAILGSYLLINWLPFDSFSIAWDPRQAAVLAAHYLALAAPFFFSGMAVGLLLAAYPQAAGQTYAVNLVGSAAGCLLALLAPAAFGGEGMVTLSSGLVALAALACAAPTMGNALAQHANGRARLPGALGHPLNLLATGLVVLTGLDLGLRLAGGAGLPGFELRLSPYKALSYALQYPGAEVVFSRWNATSRLDLVRSPGIRSLPGLSYRYLQPPPSQDGLLIDGDELSPVVRPGVDLAFAAYLPQAIAYQLRPQAEALVLEPRGGLDILAALAGSARQVTAVEVNPLIVQAAAHIYRSPGVVTVVESDRSYLRRTQERFDVVVFSLASSYHPVRSGAYSLAEDYRYTVEAIGDALARLKPGGLLLLSRWLQTPPSEELRAFALAATALERRGLDPRPRVVAFRGYNAATLLVKLEPFTEAELAQIRDFTASRSFDMIIAPGIQSQEVNRYNVLPQPVYSQAFQALLEARPRVAFYASYPYEVYPPTDDRPFFGHYFKWSQAWQVWAELGKTWQPFGGAGYFVVLGMLALAAAAAAGLILLPAYVARRSYAAPRSDGPPGRQSAAPYLLYFGWIGLGFLQVEIPLIQRFILYLGQPAYALTAVIFSLLLFSGLGSHWGSGWRLKRALGLLVLLLALAPFALPVFFEQTLGLPLWLRLTLTALVLAPLGFLMGIPFPEGIRWLVGGQASPRVIPWAWAVNGACSVVSSALAALLALSFGFGWVLRLGALCYACAWLTAVVWPASGPVRHPGR